jgi:hypothetical protein
MHQFSEGADPPVFVDFEAINEWNRIREEWLNSPITDDPEEWEFHSAEEAGRDIWQSWKNSAAFSYDGGTTYFLVTDNVDPQKSMFYESVKVREIP